MVLKMQTASCLSLLEWVRNKKSRTELTLLLSSYYLSVSSFPIPLSFVLPWSHGENLPIPAVRADSQASEFKSLRLNIKLGSKSWLSASQGGIRNPEMSRVFYPVIYTAVKIHCALHVSYTAIKKKIRKMFSFLFVLEPYLLIFKSTREMSLW